MIGRYIDKRVPYIVEEVFRTLDFTLKGTERRQIERVVEAAKGNISVAARMLGIPRRTLQRKLRRKL